MNKALVEEELDRELVKEFEAKGGGPSIYRADKVIVGNKNISFTSYHHTGDNGKYHHKTRITFKKENNANSDLIEVYVQKFEKRTRQKICNLGHTHLTEEYEWDDWVHMCIGWEDFEQLLEWLQSGRFYDPRSRQAKKAGAKNGFHSKEKV